MSSQNGHTIAPSESTSSKLVETQARLELAITEMRLARVEKAKKRLTESWAAADFWGPSFWFPDRLRDTEGRQYIQKPSTATDRLYGSNWPFWRTWMEHAFIRWDSRTICVTSSIASGALTGLTSYVIGKGFTYQAQAKEKEAPPALIQAVQRVIDDFSELNEWPEMEQELFRRSRRDGEYFLRYFGQEDGTLQARIVEPECVIETGTYPREIGSYGILNDPEDVLKVTGYTVSFSGLSTDHEVVPADRMDHIKVNVDRNVKRGMPDFSFGTFDLIRTAGRALENMGASTADQAAIAEIVQHQSASSDQVQDFIDAGVDLESQLPWKSGTEGSKVYRSGTRLDIDKGQEYVVPPFSQNVQGYVTAVQSVLRTVGVRWNAPEWLVSGDASNNSYASSLTAENPFVKTCTRRQAFYSIRFLRAIWRAIRYWCEQRGGIRAGGQIYSWETIRALVTIKAEGSRIETRNRAEQAGVDQTYASMKVKSPQTIALEQGLDWEQESLNWQEFDDINGAPGGGLPMPTQDGRPGPGLPQPGGEDEETDAAAGASIEDLFGAEEGSEQAPYSNRESMPLVSSSMMECFDRIKDAYGHPVARAVMQAVTDLVEGREPQDTPVMPDVYVEVAAPVVNVSPPAITLNTETAPPATMIEGLEPKRKRKTISYDDRGLVSEITEWEDVAL